MYVTYKKIHFHLKYCVCGEFIIGVFFFVFCGTWSRTSWALSTAILFKTPSLVVFQDLRNVQSHRGHLATVAVSWEALQLHTCEENERGRVKIKIQTQGDFILFSCSIPTDVQHLLCGVTSLCSQSLKRSSQTSFQRCCWASWSSRQRPAGFLSYWLVKCFHYIIVEWEQEVEWNSPRDQISNQRSTALLVRQVLLLKIQHVRG